MSDQNFDRSVGTYMKVVRFGESRNSDGFIILYLRPNGRFLFVGYWCGYERTAVVGHWSRRGTEVHLFGGGQAATCTSQGDERQRFTHVLGVEDADHTPCLMAKEQLEGWSLLSWRGPFMYVGQATIIAPDGEWLPKSLAEIDEWIEQELETPQPPAEFLNSTNEPATDNGWDLADLLDEPQALAAQQEEDVEETRQLTLPSSDFVNEASIRAEIDALRSENAKLRAASEARARHEEQDEEQDEEQEALPPWAGKDFPWDLIAGQFLRIQAFTPFTEVVGDSVGPSVAGVCGVATVELPSPDAPAERRLVRLPVQHKSDYKSLVRAALDSGVKQGTNELVVLYEPRRSFLSRKPCLHVAGYPSGTWGRFFAAVSRYEADKFEWPSARFLYQPSGTGVFPGRPNLFAM